MELLKCCALCVIMALPQLECSEDFRKLVVGDFELITCKPNMTVAGLLSDNAHLFVRQPNDVVLFRNINPMAGNAYPDPPYSMKLETIDSQAIFHFNFTNLKESDSGLWQCVNETKGQKKYYRNITFSVKPAEDVGRVELTLTKVGSGKEVKLIHDDGSEEATQSSVTLLSGKYTMTCVAEKGYPEPEYTLFRDGNRISTETSATVNLTTADTNLGCNVLVNRKEFKEHSLYFNLKIEDVEPEIRCRTTSARINDGRAVMNCTVVAADVTCKKVEWKSGTTNNSFQHGGPKVIGYDLRCKSNGKNSVWSSLEVRNLKQQHFDETYFIKIKDSVTGDFQKEHPLQIQRKPGALNGSVQMAPLGSLTLVAVVTMLKMFL
ncbi:uncharacterized protein LOC117343136 [Pecten maximus]|uniref:uncharacterized protein LOC117343136 n=1 Tax=Pecten maximus TaxID=6579 RepID=UPI0014590B27|nr:uncharacterized protein LOC117343136 [Pecten maximus]